MELKLAENIYRLRREKRMTQEQLAEALGVTVGAVSKWESASTTPEISMIVQLAVFFETSVDVLLGYQWYGSSLEDMLEQMKALQEEKRHNESISIGEKALAKYPNNFDVVYQTAVSCLSKSGSKQEESTARRGYQLFSHALELFSQNKNDEISQWLIRNQMGECCLHFNQMEQALKIFKANNINGVNNARIAQLLADVLKRYDEAEVYAFQAYRQAMSDMVAAMIAVSTLKQKTNDVSGTEEGILWLIQTLKSLRPVQGVCQSDKILVNLLQAMAEFYCREGEPVKAKAMLKKAMLLAFQYDATPWENVVASRFIPKHLPGKSYFDTGETAKEMMLNRRKRTTQEELPAYYSLWDEIVLEERLCFA